MKNKKISALLMGLACAGLLFATASCSEDTLSTDQMSSTRTTIQAYGPRPAMRGAEIRFIGTHMDRVTAVTFPVAGEVTEFTKKEVTEIRVIVPANAGYGPIMLKTPNGDITTDSEMTYTEPIEVTYVTQEPVRAGDVIEIKGHFLYLVTRVIFQGAGSFVDVTDADKTFSADDPAGEQTITVTVPETARSGRLTLSNVIFDANNKEIGVPVEVASGNWQVNITEPSVTGFSPSTIKAGTTLTITGKNLDLVKAVRFSGGVEVETFTDRTATSFKVAVPEDAQDGAVTLVTKSGTETASADELTMLLPAIVSIAPDPVRNGTKLTVDGTDLDLVSNITFIGADAIDIGDASVTVKTATKIEVSVPLNAKEGPVTFSTKAAKDVKSADMKLVKPVVSGYGSSAVSAGGEVTFKGADLDLVTAVTFPEGLAVDIADAKAASATSLTLTVPSTAVDGDVTLTMVNGDAIECPDLTIGLPQGAYIPEPPKEVNGDVFAIEIANEDKLTSVQINGTTVKHILSGKTLFVYTMLSAIGTDAEIKLISSNGETFYTIKVLGDVPVETIVWEGTIDMNAAPWSAVAIPFGGFEGAKAGAICRFYFRDGTGEPNIQPNYGDWAGMVTDLRPAADAPYAEFELTQENLDIMMNPAWSGAAFQLQGSGCVIYKITYIQ